MKQAGGDSPIKVFGVMLAFYRDRAGLTPEQLGALVNVSGSLIRKVEAGHRTASEQLVAACEAIEDLHCDGALRELFENMRQYMRTGVFPGWFAEWPEKEASAVRLRSFQLVVLPGLVQPETYARALISVRIGMTLDAIDEEVAARLARQVILDRDNPPVFWIILDEGVLRRPIGSREVMREALTHLAELARRPNLVVQVIPLAAGAHQGLPGAGFVIAEFDDAPDVAYQDTSVSGQIIHDKDAIKDLVHTWEALQRVTLPEALSVRAIEETIDELWT